MSPGAMSPVALSPIVRAGAVVFIASFCTLVLELVAGRVLAPYVGVSLYTWTSIIGVVLAGISAGAWAGGRLADRRPAASTLAWLLFASGVAALLIAPATSMLAAENGLLTTARIAMTLLQRVVILSFLLFFVPSFLLGMISPVAVKLAVRDMATAGSVVGKIYALSTLGSIAGTFTTGFYLVARFGTRATILGVGVVLIASALMMASRWGPVVAAVAIAMAILWPRTPLPPAQNLQWSPRETGIIHREESQYYAIQVDRTVRADTGAPIHALHLDRLIQSYADLADPTFLEYGYLHIFDTLIGSDDRRLLFIGGGGYTLPRKIEHERHGVAIDVVEIDPAVTRVAQRYFGVPRDTHIRTFTEDARWFATRPRGPYDVIFIDAFNDLSVPYHLTTRETTLRLRSMLAPGGTLAANVIDDFRHGHFLASYVRTVESVFGEANVTLAMEDRAATSRPRATFVVIASARSRPFSGATLPPAALRDYLARRQAIVLTDDFAPVDQMLAPLFAARALDE